MNDRKTRSRSAGGGMGLPILITIILIIIKFTVTARRDMAWYWVFSPIWIFVGLGIVFMIFIGCCLIGALIGFCGASSAGIADGIKGWFGKKEDDDIKDVSFEEHSDENPG
jgi:hypothetical protein